MFLFSFKTTVETYLVYFNSISLDIVGCHSSTKMAIKKEKKIPEKFIDFMFPNFPAGSPQFYRNGKELLQIAEKKKKIKD